MIEECTTSFFNQLQCKGLRTLETSPKKIVAGGVFLCYLLSDDKTDGNHIADNSAFNFSHAAGAGGASPGPQRAGLSEYR
jgi:hypothetical protein